MYVLYTSSKLIPHSSYSIVVCKLWDRVCESIINVSPRAKEMEIMVTVGGSNFAILMKVG